MLNTLIDIVKKAAEIMLSAQNIKDNTESKGDRNFVTVYDKKVQKYIESELKAIYPDILFMGEEGDSRTIDLNTQNCFILDPIDGTANFRRSYRHSAISLGYCEKGVIKLGVVYDPYNNDLFYAERNKGAYHNKNRIFTEDTALKNSFVGFGTSPYYPELSIKTMEAMPNILADCEDIRRTGSAALDLAYIACGRHDVFFELQLSPWDYAASVVIIEEAGGIITDDKGNTPKFDKPTPIFAGNKKAYKEFFDKNYFI